MPRLRLFVAADAPPGHLARVDKLLAPLHARLRGARWTAPEGRHITLKFLGYAAPDALGEIDEAIGRASAAVTPAEVRLGGLGAFPSARRARVLWLGIDDPHGVTTGLAGALDEALAPLGFEAEKRAFRPHLTLARFKVPGPVETELPAQGLADLPPFRISVTTLYRSHLSPTGARYEPLRRFPLGSLTADPSGGK